MEVETTGQETQAANDSAAASAPAVEAPKLEKLPSETDAEFAARVAGAAPKPEPFKLSPRGEFQDWIERNYRSISFPALSELESMLDRCTGKLSADEVKYFADRRK